MSFVVLPDETLEDLQINGLYILQKKDSFRFGMDAVLLSNFIKAKAHQKVLDKQVYQESPNLLDYYITIYFVDLCITSHKYSNNKACCSLLLTFFY